MSSKGTKRALNNQISPNDKLSAIRRVHDGESKASVARDIGVPESTLRGWCKNEQKITYMSGKSSPETDESLDLSRRSKKAKYDRPNSSTSSVEYARSHKAEAKCKPPTNPRKAEAQKAATSCAALSEKVRNRAELARIRIQLGLNQQEMFIPTVNNSTTSASLNNLTAELFQSHWNSMYNMHQQHMRQIREANKTSAQAEPSIASPSVGLLTTVDRERAEKLPSEKQSVHESVSHWLKTQQVCRASSNMENNSNGMSPPTATIVKDAVNPNLNGMTADEYALYWTALCNNLASISQEQPLLQALVPHPLPHVVHQEPPQVSFSCQQVSQAQPQVPDKPILFQRLTEDVKEVVQIPLQSPLQQREVGNLTSSRQTKKRSVLDDLLFNNNNVDSDETNENVGDMSRSEALEHGEIFLKWVSSHPNPSVTATQLIQFKTLINNVHMDGERKNGVLQNKTKVKRK